MTGHLFFRMLGLRVTYLEIDKRNAYLSYSSCSFSVLPSNAEKRVINYAVARSVSAVYRLSSNTPLFVRNCINFSTAWWIRKKAKMAKIKTAYLMSRLEISSMHPGSFSAWSARLLERVGSGVCSKRHLTVVAC